MVNLLLERVAFSIFGLEVYWYGLIITSAIVLDFILLMLLCKKFNYDQDLPFDLIIFAVLFGIVCARLFSVLFDEGASLKDYFAFRDGGMSIIGALIGGVCGIGLYCLLKKKNFFEITDCLAPLVLLAQGIGRWGNYFNNEVYGQQVLNESLQWFPYAVKIGTNYYQALFFYESVLNILGFAGLIILLFKFRHKRGLITALYLMYYGTVRFFLEQLRQPKYILRLAGLPISQILSGMMFLSGLAILIFIIINDYKSKKKVMGK